MPAPQNIPAGSSTEPEGPSTGEVREIHPGVRAATPAQARKHKNRRHSEAGMATAEFTKAV